MVELPEDHRLKVERLIEDEVVIGERRGYLGLSQIGKECPRSLWYDFRFCSKKEFPARIARLFQRGHQEEPIIVADLEKAGIRVHSDQAEVMCGSGHIKGHIDGIGENVPDAPKTLHLLEFKTMADKYFLILGKKGVKESNPVYYVQCQCYMRLMKLTQTLFIAVNKNNDKRYYERLSLEKNSADYWLQRGEDIIFDENPPIRFESFECGWCDHKPVCKERALPERNCRTCQHCDMENEGKWSCSKAEQELSLKHQLWLAFGKPTICPQYRLLNTLKN